MSRDSTRRRFLEIAGTGALASLAGCASMIGDVSPDTTPEGTDAGTQTRTSDPAGASSSGSQNVSGSGSSGSGSGSSGSGEADSEGDSWSVESVTIDPADISLSSVPVPAGQNGSQSRYARMGREGASTVATLFGNWKCPYTQEFVLNDFPEVVDQFVRTGDLAIEFRSLAYLNDEPFLGPDAPRAAQAGLAVWELDPEAYWSYFGLVFSNQPQERHPWAKPSLLERFAESSDVSQTDELVRRVENGRYADAVEETTDVAVDQGVTTVPRIAVDGSLSAPTVDFEKTLSQLESAVE